MVTPPDIEAQILRYYHAEKWTAVADPARATSEAGAKPKSRCVMSCVRNGRGSAGPGRQLLDRGYPEQATRE
jgi:hypothetical protein